MLLVALLLLKASAIRAASPVDIYPALMDTLVAGYYPEALSVCDALDRDYPDHPGSSYARAAVWYAHITDFEDTTGRGQFMYSTQQCMDRSDAWQKSGRGNLAEIDYLWGSALAARGLLFNHEGSLLPALRLLISAKAQFDAAIAADPTFYDAYLGRGAYRYAVAKNAGAVRWLPFIPSAESGWKDLWLAVEKSKFSRYPALTSIVWFAIGDKNTSLADSICTAGLNRFPGCRSFLFPRLALDVQRADWSAAEQIAGQLLNQYLIHPDNNGYEPIGLYWRLMKCADALGRPDDAVGYARAGLATFRTPDAANRREDKLSDMQERLNAASQTR